ncbi:MAG: glycosyltransferase [Phycisphaerae bacterium]
MSEFLELIRQPRLPWRMTHRGGALNTCLLAPLRRSWFRFRLRNTPDQPGVSVVIPVRNRIDARIRNCLQSLREQDYPAEKIHILIVEYGSDQDADIPYLLSLCEKYNADCYRTGPQERWNKPHAQNVGLKRVKTDLVMLSDNDQIFSANYISAAVRKLVESPLSVVYAPILDMPERLKDELMAEDLDLQVVMPEWKEVCEPRTHGLCHPGCLMTHTMLIHYIRGLDENIFGWGVQDNDIQKRLYLLGCKDLTVAGEAYYLHQWHPKGQSLSSQEVNEYTAVNWAYVQEQNSCRRNPLGWGGERPMPTRNLYWDLEESHG